MSNLLGVFRKPKNRINFQMISNGNTLKLRFNLKPLFIGANAQRAPFRHDFNTLKK